MSNAYKEMADRHQKEFNAFPIMFAFSDKQFEEGMAKLGLSPDDTDKIYKFGDTGGFYLRTDAKWLREMIEDHGKEMQDAIAADPTGEGFIFDMFDYELANHEYIISHCIDSTLDALGLEPEDIAKDPRLQHGLKLAKKRQFEKLEEEDGN